MTTHIHVMKADDWQGLYINNELWLEREVIEPEEVAAAVLDAVGGDYEITVSVKSDQYINPQSPFCPDILPKEMRK